MKTLKKSLVPHVAKDSTESAGLPSCGSRVFFMEQWKAIKDYEGIYEISDQGRVKSIERNIMRSNGRNKPVSERILKPGKNHGGYYHISLSKKGLIKKYFVHALIWDHFGDRPRNGRKLQIDHVNEIKTDNRIDNLQLLTQRENNSKGWRNKKKSSKYTGVSWDKTGKIWKSYITINGKLKYLGNHKTEINAHLAYQSELKKILQNGQN